MSDFDKGNARADGAFRAMVEKLTQEIANRSPEYQEGVWAQLKEICKNNNL